MAKINFKKLDPAMLKKLKKPAQKALGYYKKLPSLWKKVTVALLIVAVALAVFLSVDRPGSGSKVELKGAANLNDAVTTFYEGIITKDANMIDWVLSPPLMDQIIASSEVKVYKNQYGEYSQVDRLKVIEAFVDTVPVTRYVFVDEEPLTFLKGDPGFDYLVGTGEFAETVTEVKRLRTQHEENGKIANYTFSVAKADGRWYILQVVPS